MALPINREPNWKGQARFRRKPAVPAEIAGPVSRDGGNHAGQGIHLAHPVVGGVRDIDVSGGIYRNGSRVTQAGRDRCSPVAFVILRAVPDHGRDHDLPGPRTAIGFLRRVYRGRHGDRRQEETDGDDGMGSFVHP
jgi:hypothetical protein